MPEKSIFPDPEKYAVDGVVAVSRDLNCQMLCDAYANGIFPWPYEEESVLWCSPEKRGILMLDKFHIPKSFQREMRKCDFALQINHDFDSVIRHCAAVPRKGQDGTWITSKIIRTYSEFHRQKKVHSFEVYDSRQNLVGGLYGVVCNRIFCGESMFFLRSGASKYALVKLVEILKKHDFLLIDTQMVTPMTSQFGAKEIPRKEYLSLLKKSGSPPLAYEW